MAAVPPGQPIAPGVAAATSGYPQWGVGGGTPGSSAGWKIVEATTAAQKTSYASQGYLAWFSSDSNAKAFLAEEESPISSGEPQNAIPGVSAFFTALGDSNTWIRVAKVVVGGLLLVIGLVHITGADNAVATAARKVPLPI
jgi:hypothetical protein